ncbi:MAG: phage tail tape measure protein [Pseudomonadota bacterium]
MTTEHLTARIGADISGYKSGMSKVGSIAQQGAKDIATYAKRAAIAIAGIGTAAALVGSKFEFELMKTATVAQAFGRDLDLLRDKARELGRTTAFTAAEAAKGMYDLASAGMNTKQILAATGSAMVLAGATSTEMAQATYLLASTLRQFNLRAEESQRVVDTYAQAITSSLLTMDKLSEAMKYAGTSGAALGWSLEETTAAVAQFVNLGLQGTMAGTNLRMSMVQLSKQGDSVTKALKEMNLVFEDVNPQTHTFGEILKTVGDAGITVTQAVDMFGTRAGLNMKKLAEYARDGALDFDGFVKKLIEAQEGTGRAAKMYERMMDTFQGRWKIFISNVKEAGIEIYYAFEGAGKWIFDFLSEGLRNLTSYIRQNRDNIQKAVVDTLVMMTLLAAAAVKPILALKFAWQAVKFAVLAVMKVVADKLAWILEKGAWLAEKFPGEFLEETGRKLKGASEEFRTFSDVLDNSLESQIVKVDAAAISYSKAAEGIEKWKNKILEWAITTKANMPKGGYGPKPAGAEPTKPATWETPMLPAMDFRSQGMKELEAYKEIQKLLEEFRLKTSANRFEQIKMQYDSEIEEITSFYTKQVDLMKQHGATKEQLEKLALLKSQAIAKKERQSSLAVWQEKISAAQQGAAMLTNIAEMLYVEGSKNANKMFRVMKMAKIAEAVINTAAGILQAIGNWPPPISYVLAGITAAMGAVQIAQISAQKPPAYEYGGIVRGAGNGQGQLIRAGEGGDEAVVPLRGGSIPVVFSDREGNASVRPVQENHYHLEGSTFMDQQVLAETLDAIAVRAVRRDYQNDGQMRSLIRSRD